MSKEYSKEELWKLYKNLPEELKEAIFSEKIAEDIYRICERYGISECGKLSKIVGHTFLGILPPSEIEETLRKELLLTSGKAKKISNEIHRFIFYPFKKEISLIYSKEIETLKEDTKKEIEKKRDIYREPIE